MSIRMVMVPILLLVFALAGVAHAETIRVPQDHAKIQDAVNAAVNGDTIEIKGGRYAENVVVGNKTDLSIVGKGRVTLLPSTNGTGLLANNCTNLVVQGIGTDGGETGFDFQDCDGVLLENFKVRGPSEDGVYAAGSRNVRVIRGKISDCGHDGVSFADENAGRPVIGGEITQVKIKDVDEDGVDVLGENVTVSACKVTNADDDAFETDGDAVGNITMDRCKAKNSGDEGFELFAPRSIVTNSKTVKSDDDGFDVEGDDSRLENCKAVRAGENGIEIELAEGVTIEGCKAIKSGANGFSVEDSSGCTIDGCKAVGSREDGFSLDSETSGNTLRNNRAGKSGDFDLDDDSSGENTIEDNNRFRKVDVNED